MEVIETIEKYGLIPVAVIRHVERAAGTAQALCEGGLPVIEVTMRTEAALDALRSITRSFPAMLAGAGTVLTLEQCKAALDAGARFIVAPGFNEALVSWCCAHGVPVIPGAVTPTEIEKALSFGVHTLKFFPANIYGGAAGCAALYGPYQSAGIRFIPTGGVGPDNLADYAARPFIAAVGGSWMCRADDVDAGNFDRIRDITRQAVRTMLGLRVTEVEVYHDRLEPTAADSLWSLLEPGSLAVTGRVAPQEAVGRITIRVNRMDRAIFFLERLGFAVDERTALRKNDAITSVCLREPVDGFTVYITRE